ncbi:MAG: TRAM domain-containing protein [Rhodomicrobium sp.]
MKKRSLEQCGEPSNPRHPDDPPVTVAIEAMGAQGHGIGRVDGGKIFIPCTLPGETVRVELHGQKAVATKIETPSRSRIEPVCRHFGTCGGCALQHWAEPAYKEWKQGLVTSALSRAGINAQIEPLRSYPVSSRRRATFTARRLGADIELGYNAMRTHAVIDLEECPILLPQIVSALLHLKDALIAAMPSSGEAKISVTAAANGLDCAVEGPRLAPATQAKLVSTLGAAGFIRASWNGELVLLSAQPFVTFGGVRVAPGPNAFLQAVEACERDMADWVLDALSQAHAASGPVCDLFAGLGAFTFPAARIAAVTAYEESPEAVAGLAAAAKQAKAIKAVSAIRRDLFRSPLGPLELNKFTGIIIDPPREGAEAQARALAASKAGAIAMLSCNPASFARDAAILISGGFKLSRLAAFDQFRFSAHVEIAGLFERRRGKKGGLAPALRG